MRATGAISRFVQQMSERGAKEGKNRLLEIAEVECYGICCRKFTDNRPLKGIQILNLVNLDPGEPFRILQWIA